MLLSLNIVTILIVIFFTIYVNNSLAKIKKNRRKILKIQNKIAVLEDRIQLARKYPELKKYPEFR